jgi:GPH family glycoside/pentoside/hexuronide:cation symporter
MFGSIYWWMVKLGLALAFALSGFLLNATGYDVEMMGAQTSNTFFWMRVVDVGIPAIASLVSIFAVASFKITEQRSYEIRSELEKRRGSGSTEAAVS